MSSGDEAGQAVVVTFSVLVYAIILYAALWYFKDSIVNEKTPLRLPKVAFVWTCFIVAGTITWQANADQTHNTEIKNRQNWFSLGWKNGFVFFNIPINNWWSYLIILLYVVTRSLLGSLLSNVFKPFISGQVQNSILRKTVESSKTIHIMLAQAAVTLFAFASALGDLFLFLSQVDVSIVSLLITLLSDAGATYAVLGDGGSKHKIVQHDTESLLLRGPGRAETSDLSARILALERRLQLEDAEKQGGAGFEKSFKSFRPTPAFGLPFLRL